VELSGTMEKKAGIDRAMVAGPKALELVEA
jgi:ABC-type transporter Mla maintaining outer membrane lipid asymmetry ATPase subunit MlaF